MDPEELKQRNFRSELVFSTSRSSGPGGQNVNKVSTRVELRFCIASTLLLSEYEKELLLRKLKNRINKELELVLVAQEGRTQLQNKMIVIDKFYDLVAKALTLPVKRRQTRPTLTSRFRRLDEKKIRSNIKKLRKGEKPSEEE
jgi:ribosome-associated protein